MIGHDDNLTSTKKPADLGEIGRRVAAALVCWVLMSLGAIPATGAAPSPGQLDPSTRKGVLQELAHQLEARYAFPDVAKQLARAVRMKENSNAYQKITSASELAQALTHDLFDIAHDKHLRIIYSPTPLPAIGTGTGPPPEMLEQLRTVNGAIPKVEVLDGNVGYMRVNGVPGVDATRAALTAGFAFLVRTDALIIDNRGNTGGDPNTVALLMSYLSDGEPYIVNTFHWREGNRIEEFRTTTLGDRSYGASKPVFVLTSPATFSGGEELSYDVQAFKRGIVVGEVTAGGANPGGPVALGHQFLVIMPSGYAKNPVTGTNWEGVGVRPDVSVPASQALGKAHTLAVERLLKDTADFHRRAALEATLVKLAIVEEAAASPTTRLSSREIVGTYVLEDKSGAIVTLFERDNRLVQRGAGLPDVLLLPLQGNRYQLEGLGDGFVTSVRAIDGKTQLLLEVPFAPPSLWEKQD